MLRVEGLTYNKKVRDVSFSLRAGEILGFYGLVGSGRSETARLIIGAEQPDRGTVFVQGQRAPIRSVREALHRYGIGYVSENRKEEGLFLEFSLVANLTLTIWQHLRRRLTRRVDPGREAQTARDLVKALSIHSTGLQQPAATLSGGNQQKVCLGKWLAAQCQILIVDEPTVGVDIGAKEQIHRLLDHLAEKEQRAILLISSDMPEIIRLADRILVFRAGGIAGEIDPSSDPDLSFEDISQAIGRFLN
jgi:ribose transport system ATP-binding protein